ncbi:hypothetical protein [Streptomyces sp. NPDC058964]|uniref:hypothetical protein n=1 Tax=Streptomyces sp. NPDC058964 TaxID=3346681 RepID=UPI00369B3CF6
MTEDEKKARNPRSGARPALGALSGALAGFAALAAAELAAAVRPQAGPVVAVGGTAIDHAPAGVKGWAIRNFGTADKLVLQLGILAVPALFALTLGVVSLRFRRGGPAGVLLFGALGAAAATGRPDSGGPSDALPSVVGAVVGAVLLHVLVAHLAPRRAVPGADGTRGDPYAGPDQDRRAFVITKS